MEISQEHSERDGKIMFTVTCEAIQYFQKLSKYYRTYMRILSHVCQEKQQKTKNKIPQQYTRRKFGNKMTIVYIGM
jgi:hypothetical protein